MPAPANTRAKLRVASKRIASNRVEANAIHSRYPNPRTRPDWATEFLAQLNAENATYQLGEVNE